MANVVGLTRMLDALAAIRLFPEQVVLTSSRAVYGEGEWEREDGTRFYPGQRDQQMIEPGRGGNGLFLHELNLLGRNRCLGDGGGTALTSINRAPETPGRYGEMPMPLPPA